MVHLTKNCLRKAIGRKLLDYEQFCTFLSQAEAMVNRRPLTYVTEDISSLEILRPVDFLNAVGGGTFQLKEGHTDEEYYPTPLSSRDKVLKYWRKHQKMLDHFWQLWQSDYLLRQQESMGLHYKHPKSVVNRHHRLHEIVILSDETLPRGCWKLGLIEKTHHGSDDAIRSVDVRMSDGTVLRR